MPLASPSSYPAATDEQLLCSMRADDGHAFAELFNRHWDAVYSMIYARVREKTITEEMAQEIFMKLWDKRAELSIDNFAGYLYTCVKHKCLNYIESKITHKKHWEYYRTFLPGFDDSTDNTVAVNDLREALEKALDTIPTKSKLIFRLNRLEGRSVKEIAETLDLSEKAIQYHLTKSTKELRLYLRDFLSILVLLFWM